MRLRHIQMAGELGKTACQITEIVRCATALRLGKPLTIPPELDAESQQWMVLEEPEVNIHVVGQAREALMEELLSSRLAGQTNCPTGG